MVTNRELEMLEAIRSDLINTIMNFVVPFHCRSSGDFDPGVETVVRLELEDLTSEMLAALADAFKAYART